MRQDPSMSKRLELATAPDRAFRPPPTGNLPLLLTLAVVAGLLCVALMQGWLSIGRATPDRAARGSRAPANNSPTAPSASGSPATSGPRVEQITKCVAKSGAAAYVDGTCPAGTRSTTIAVRPDINLADGMRLSDREASMQANSAAAQARADHERRVATSAAANTSVSECGQLETWISALDAAARQPLPAAEQDRIRGERKAARDRQFGLRCQ